MSGLAESLAQTLADDVGYILMTLLAVDEDDLARVYSSDPVVYPLSGRKRLQTTPWGDHVLQKALPWLGHTRTDLEWAFPDHESIFALGCGACLNIPVQNREGAVICTLNLFDAKGRYCTANLEHVETYHDQFAATLRDLSEMNKNRGI